MSNPVRPPPHANSGGFHGPMRGQVGGREIDDKDSNRRGEVGSYNAERLQADLNEVREILGLPTGADTRSPHRIMQEDVIPRVHKIVADNDHLRTQLARISEMVEGAQVRCG